jgi:glycosyltransferase involved in cell wall biosynthesis
MNENLVSVIICTRNRVELLQRAINSVLEQIEVKKEIIVVDDNSNDGTSRIIRNVYCNKVKIVSTKNRSGVAVCTNIGFELSNGAYIALLGDDDYWDDNLKLRKQCDIFHTCDNVGVVGTWWRELQAEKKLKSKNIRLPKSLKFAALKGGGIICGSTALIKRNIWAEVGGLDEKLPRGTDSDLFRRIILKNYDVRILPQHTTIVDLGHGNPRMTTKAGFFGAKDLVYANIYLLIKYKYQYLKYPELIIYRIIRILKSTIKAIIIYK